MSELTTFEKLSKLNISDKVEKKGRFSYLSWCYAWSEAKKEDNNTSCKVYHNEVTNLPYFGAGDAGVLVKVGVTIHGVEHINYLPAMDFKNQAIPENKVTMMDVNKTIQRATVKAIALHGIGLYIYAGEDLPDSEEKDTKSPVKKKAAEKTPDKKSGNSFRNSVKKNPVETATDIQEASNDDEEL